MYDHILIRYGEVGLKGKNQKSFLTILVRNIRSAIFDRTGKRPLITREQGRILLMLEGEEPANYYDALDHVYGISSYSPVIKTTLLAEDIIKTAQAEMAIYSGQGVSFRTTVKRANKSFPIPSPDMQKQVATAVMATCQGLQVNLQHYDVELKVDIRFEATYISTQKFVGLGGLPLGTGGRAVLMLSGGIDSPVAGWLTMKRGVVVEAIHFHSYPYTSKEAEAKVLTLAKELAMYSGKMVVHLVPFTKIQEAIGHYCHDNMRIVIMRKIMVRIAEEIAARREAMAIVTGDNLGQVASQTIESLYAVNDVTKMPILRPLVTMDKYEIIDIAKAIGTFETSILPYEDCCTVFVPKEPKTKPKVAACVQEESRLDWVGLIAQALAETEQTTIYAYAK